MLKNYSFINDHFIIKNSLEGFHNYCCCFVVVVFYYLAGN